MGEMLKVGVIGVGMAGNSHLKGFKSVNNAQVIAISDTNETVLETVAQTFKIKKSSDINVRKDQKVFYMALVEHVATHSRRLEKERSKSNGE